MKSKQERNASIGILGGLLSAVGAIIWVATPVPYVGIALIGVAAVLTVIFFIRSRNPQV